MKSVGWIAWDSRYGCPASAGYKSARKLYKSELTAKGAIHGRSDMVPVEVFAEVPEVVPGDLDRCRACGRSRNDHAVRHPFR